jgi:glycosyltransferase involved in cell wall biosynthesis
MRIVLVHDWLYIHVGSEKVVEAILSCMPVETIYTLVNFLSKKNSYFLNNVPVQSSFLQHLPWAQKLRRLYLPLMPLAIEAFDVSDADLVISSSSAIAKGILTHAEHLHICYCHTPARYAWDLTHQYLAESGLEKGLKGTLAQLILHYIRLWDVSNTNRIDYLISNSYHIAKRIWHIYRRESTVIYPPVEIDRFELKEKKEDYYLTVTRLESYKKVDLIVEVFANLKKRLVVVGDGPDMAKIKAKATPNIVLLGFQPNNVVEYLMQRAKAFIFAANEDFGIAVVEAQACGTPVIAYGRGGALETVQGVYPGEKPAAETTGIFFREQTQPSLAEALDWFEKHQGVLDPGACRKNAERFSRARFEQEFKKFVEAKYHEFQAGRRP